MAKRTTKIIGSVEYKPDHKARTSKINSMVEYKLTHKARTTKVMLMVEYVPKTGRVLGPAAQ